MTAASTGLRVMPAARRRRIIRMPFARLDPMERCLRRQWDRMSIRVCDGVTIVCRADVPGGVKYRVLVGECDRERAFFDPPCELARVYCRPLDGRPAWYSSMDFTAAPRPHDTAEQALAAALRDLGVSCDE